MIERLSHITAYCILATAALVMLMSTGIANAWSQSRMLFLKVKSILA